MADKKKLGFPVETRSMPEQAAHEHVVAVRALVDSMKHKLGVLDPEPPLEEQQQSTTIHRVLPSVRSDDAGAYDPKILSIGPFHRGKESLRGMEDLKWGYARDLLDRSPEHNKLERYVGAVWAEVERARRYYSEEIVLGDNDFVKMLVLDGCFIVEFLIRCCLGKNMGRRLSAENWNLQFVGNDLLLLENQIPFFIPQILFDMSVIPIPELEDDDESPPLTLVELALTYLTEGKMDTLPAGSCTEVYHLLHLLHLSLNPNLVPGKPATYSCGQLLLRVIRKTKRLIFLLFFGLLYLLITIFSLLNCKWRCCRSSEKKSSRFPRMIPCAMELQEAGVKLRRKEMDCDNFLRVTFEDGTMEIPFLNIEESTNSRFRNLIAFEQCCPNAAGSHFTSYAVFMDNIVDTPIDVAILRGCGIIESKLGSDKEVAVFFNKLCRGGYLDYEKHYLAGLFRKVKEYCESDRHRWRARLVHDYFGNPWAVISLIAAFVLLVLTAMQTFFAVYAYYHPPS